MLPARLSAVAISLTIGRSFLPAKLPGLELQEDFFPCQKERLCGHEIRKAH